MKPTKCVKFLRSVASTYCSPEHQPTREQQHSGTVRPPAWYYFSMYAGCSWNCALNHATPCCPSRKILRHTVTNKTPISTIWLRQNAVLRLKAQLVCCWLATSGCVQQGLWINLFKRRWRRACRRPRTPAVHQEGLGSPRP